MSRLVEQHVPWARSIGLAEAVDALILSTKVASVALALALPIAILAAYALARWRFPGRSVLHVAIYLPLVLPPVVTGYFLLAVFGRNAPLGSMLESAFGISFAFSWKGAALASAVEL